MAAIQKKIKTAKIQKTNMVIVMDEQGRILHGSDEFLKTLDNSQTAQIHFDRIEGSDGQIYYVGSPADQAGKKTASTMDAKFTKSLLKSIAKKGADKIDEQADEKLLGNFLNMSNDIMAIADSEGHFSRVNSSFNSLLGYKDAELQKMHFLDLLHNDDRALIKNTLLDMDELPDGQVINFESRVQAKDGQLLHIEWSHKRQGDSIYIVGRDMTAMKKNEKELRTQQKMLREAQALGHIGNWRWSPGSQELDWSDEIFNIFGVEPDSFTPTLDNVNAMLSRPDMGRMMQAFQRAIIGRNDFDLEFEMARPDGETRYVRCQGRCSLSDDGDVSSLFGIMQDITHHTLYERQLREAKDAAEHAYNAKSQFLANMSHELRTPLNAIIGFSEMMQQQLLGPIGSEKYLDYIAGIRESGEHLLDLISDILDMSKIEAGKYELDLEEINVGKVIRLGLHMMEGKAQEANVKININIDNEDLKIVADRRAVMQILLNLVSNAVKFTKESGTVSIECQEREDYIILKVTDTGIGIPANKLQYITRPFEQAAYHYTREHEGTGLGLAITKDLVELHGGTMHIESTVDVGTTVRVRLPLDAYKQMKLKKQKDADSTKAA